MKKTVLLTLAATAWPALSLAQVAGDQVATPTAAVPALSYASAFDAYPKGVEQQMDAWPAANARVGQYTRGHSDILKAEEAQAAPHTPAVRSGMPHSRSMHIHHGVKP